MDSNYLEMNKASSTIYWGSVFWTNSIDPEKRKLIIGVAIVLKNPSIFSKSKEVKWDGRTFFHEWTRTCQPISAG